MGYYNGHYPPNPHRKKSRRWLVPALLGAIIGILLVVVAIPAMTDSSITPGVKSNQTAPGKDGTDYVNVDVTSQITEVVDEVSPAVIGVTNIQNHANFWDQQEATEAGTGSGVIYKKEDGHAYAITNHHVVEGADMVEVDLADGTDVKADLLGSDLFSDLAVLRFDDEHVDDVVEMGSSSSIKVGEPAIAIGNPLGRMFSGSVTQGVISGKQRTIPQDFNQDGRADWQAEVIQTDAAINPGNSGGALINIEAQLIGINSMKINQEAVEGIGFAIPIDTARPIVDELEKTGEVKRAYLGVEIYSLDEVPHAEWKDTLKLPKEVKGGVYVWSVEPLSPADQSGIRRLDVITELDGKEVLNMVDFRKILYQKKKIGDNIKITFYRDGKKQEKTVKLGVQDQK